VHTTKNYKKSKRKKTACSGCCWSGDSNDAVYDIPTFF